jgi:hypothetical protein
MIGIIALLDLVRVLQTEHNTPENRYISICGEKLVMLTTRVF